MGKFLKNFGLGLVYIVLLPFLLIALVLFAIYGLDVCIYLFFASTIRFFQGKEMFPTLPEDVKIAEIKKAQMDAQFGTPAPSAPQASAPAGPSTVYVQQNYYQGQKENGASSANPQQPAIPHNEPIDTTGYFKHAPQPPVLDVTTPKAPQLSNEITPTAIPQNSAPEPTAYIDISHDEDPKGDK